MVIRPLHVLALVGALIATLATATACAQSAPPSEAAATEGANPLAAGLELQVRQLALDTNRAAMPGTPRLEVVVGQLDARLRLAPCARVEPYLPEGTRLWGRSRIGLRCVDGTKRWNVYLPVTVKAFGPGLVATGGASAGSVLASTDVALAEVDLAEDPSAALSNSQLVVGRELARALKPGQSLRQSHLKARQWFAAGDTVTVLAQGAGFSVAGEAQALSNGIEGQPARVRTEAGRVITGLPVGTKRLELAL